MTTDDTAKDEMDEVQPGDYLDIDEYVVELREHGYEVSYENLWSGTAGFFAEVTVNDTIHCYIEGSGSAHMVKDVETPLSVINQTGQAQ